MHGPLHQLGERVAVQTFSQPSMNTAAGWLSQTRIEVGVKVTDKSRGLKCKKIMARRVLRLLLAVPLHERAVRQ